MVTRVKFLDGDNAVVGTLTLDNGTYRAEPADRPFPASVLEEKVIAPNAKVYSKKDGPEFMAALRFHYKSAYLRATEPEEIGGSKHLPTFADLARMEAKYKDWVTMGGVECAEDEGEHCGGTAVHLDSEGKIDKGPAHTVGKKPDELPKRRWGGKAPTAPKVKPREEQPAAKQPPEGESVVDKAPKEQKPAKQPKDESVIDKQPKETTDGRAKPKRPRPRETEPETPADRGQVAEADQRPGVPADAEVGAGERQPANKPPARSVPASVQRVNQRLDRYEQAFRSKGNHKVADWLGLMRNHVNSVGVEDALAALGEEVTGTGEDVQYTGAETSENYEADFIEQYLDRAGIMLVGSDADMLPEKRVISTVASSSDAEGVHERGDERDYFPQLQKLRDKLHEAQHLPGLEKSEDIGKLMGQAFGTLVPEFTPEFVKKLDEVYGEGKWIVKSYGNEAYAGYGVFFPQRVQQIQQEARNIIWDSGQRLAGYGFEHVREMPDQSFAQALQGKYPEVVDPDRFRVGKNYGAGEHEVYYNPTDDRFIKIKQQAEAEDETREEYLKRHAALNAVWPELGYRIEGITQDNRPIISVSAIGGRHPTHQEVDDWLWENDWEPAEPGWERGQYNPVEDPPDWWRNRRTGMVINDTQPANWKSQSGRLVPIDVGVTGDLSKLPKQAPHGRIVGVKGQDGNVFRYGSDKYDQQLYGDVRRAANAALAPRSVYDPSNDKYIRIGSAASSEHGAAIPEGRFMAQPAFPVVGVTDAERAAGVTFKEGQEGRTHIVTRNGKAELVPHSTWLKQKPLPVVFESDDTRAMAQAALDAINALPESERQGQLYAPDIVKTADGYKVVEANPANEAGASGYLQDNPLIIDAYVSHLTGREPAHVKFIRKLLSQHKRGKSLVDFARVKMLRQHYRIKSGMQGQPCTPGHTEERDQCVPVSPQVSGGQFSSKPRAPQVAASSVLRRPDSDRDAARQHTDRWTAALRKLNLNDETSGYVDEWLGNLKGTDASEFQSLATLLEPDEVITLASFFGVTPRVRNRNERASTLQKVDAALRKTEAPRSSEQKSPEAGTPEQQRAKMWGGFIRWLGLNDADRDEVESILDSLGQGGDLDVEELAEALDNVDVLRLGRANGLQIDKVENRADRESVLRDVDRFISSRLGVGKSKTASGKAADFLPPLKKPRVNLGGQLTPTKRKELVSSLFGKDIDEGTLGAMANAVDGTDVAVSKSMRREAIMFSWESKDAGAQRTLHRDAAGNLVMHNDQFVLEDTSPHKGKGFEFFINQVQALKEAGVSRIETHAAGNKDREWNGYYTWPRFGYDGTMQNSAFNRLPVALREKLGNSRSVLDLMELPGGKEAWKEYGNDIYDAHFDLADDSRSMKVLKAYLDERKTRGKSYRGTAARSLPAATKAAPAGAGRGATGPGRRGTVTATATGNGNGGGSGNRSGLKILSALNTNLGGALVPPPAQGPPTKPKNCTCKWPEEKMRNGSGHRDDCPCHAEWLAAGGFARNRFGVKSVPTPPKVDGGYFATCERDEQGHCLPAGGGSSAQPQVPPSPFVPQPTSQPGAARPAHPERGNVMTSRAWDRSNDPPKQPIPEVSDEELIAMTDRAEQRVNAMRQQAAAALAKKKDQVVEQLRARGGRMVGYKPGVDRQALQALVREGKVEQRGSVFILKEGKSLDYQVKAGYTGTRKDKLGRERCYQQGKLVPCQGGAQASAPQQQSQQTQPTATAQLATVYTPVVLLQQSQQRAYDGKQVETKTRLTKDETGKLGESIVLAYLHANGMTDAQPLNEERNNFPIDMVQDHETIECKAGQVSNSPGAQQWRLTIGEPGKEEKAALAKMSDEEKAAHNAEKMRMIHARKEKAMQELAKKLGYKPKLSTMTVLINPDTQTADLFKFDGVHDRIGWNSDMMKQGYIGSFKYTNVGGQS